MRAEFVEARAGNFGVLAQCLGPYSAFATARHAAFEDVLPELARRARHHTTFLYVDPYSVKGLPFIKMKAVYDQISAAGASIEVLLNLNVNTFMRWALSVVKRQPHLSPGEEDEADHQADDPAEAVEGAALDDIAGGSYWRLIAEDPHASFPQKLELLGRAYLNKLAGSFRYAASYVVKEKYEHRVPKYALVYGTRHPDGFELINDAMCKARQEFLGDQFNRGSLFDCVPPRRTPGPRTAKGGHARSASRRQAVDPEGVATPRTGTALLPVPDGGNQRRRRRPVEGGQAVQ